MFPGRVLLLITVVSCLPVFAQSDSAQQVTTKSGVVEGAASNGVRSFKGIPFAAPPVGPLRWKPPQPVASWTGVRKATEFGARCMQGHIYNDMIFRDSGPSEDCLYLNVWTPATSADAKLPVMVWIYGGGFQAGAASEPRQDGEKLATKGVVVVSMNYRLGLFGFFSHPELTAESPEKASGNYGLMDQTAALQWVRDNIAAFGGDPDNVSIFGESAGSMSVSSQMASPMAQGLFKKAMGESGSVFMMQPFPALSVSEKTGEQFAASVGAKDIAALRAMDANELLKDALKTGGGFRFWPNVDGHFFPEAPAKIYENGKQAHVPLLAGWNEDEQSAAAFFRGSPMTKENFENKVRQLYGKDADVILNAYKAANDEQAKTAARDLASDQFIAYSTWKWTDEQLATGQPVYRYHFEQAPPQPAGQKSRGAYHSADIQYVFEDLDSSNNPWTPGDRKLSEVMSSYWSNFAKNGDPNGPGLPQWPRDTKADGYEVMHLEMGNGVQPHAAADITRAQYEAIDSVLKDRH